VNTFANDLATSIPAGAVRHTLRAAAGAKLRITLMTVLVAIFALGGASPAAAQRAGAAASTETTLAALTAPAGGADDTDRPVLQHRDARYRICPSDVIALTFPLTPEFNQTVNVQPDGFISLAGAGDVYLQGRTTQESAAAIQAAYAKILHDPIVTIELKDFNKPYFIVTGQVHKAGKFDLRGYTTATQAVAIAGGFNEAAKHSQVLLFRRVNDDWFEVKLLNLKRILGGHNVNEDVEVRPGDMLFVPQNVLSKVKKFIPSSGMGSYYQFH
jgi:polysaccharide export outer membrane protein